MDRPTSRSLRTCLAGLAGAAVVAGVLTPGVAAAQTAPASPSPSPTGSASASASAGATASPSAGTAKDAPGRELPAPRVVGPRDALSPAALTYRKHVVLDWEPVLGATGYRVEVGQDENWADVPVLEQDVVSTELTLPLGLPHASYLWRVSSLDGSTHGAWSEGSFTKQWTDTPTPLGPNGPVTGRPTFSWSPVADASAYELQISTSPTFGDSRPTETQASPQVDTCFTSHTRVTPFTGVLSVDEDNPGACVFSLLGTGEQRYWRVRALDRVVEGGAEGATKPASSEGISHLPPNSSPADIASACPGATPVPTVAPVGAATPTASPSPTPAANGEKGEASGCTPTHEGEKGSWSATTPFGARYPSVPLVDYRTLDRPSVHTVESDPRSAPVCPSGTCVDVPTLTWDAVPGASRYRVYVALKPTYDNIVRVVETSATEWTATDTWRDNAAGASYYYVVQPCTVEGCGGVTPTPPSFRKSSRAVVPVLTPVSAAGAVLKAGDVPLAWTSLASRVRAVEGGESCGSYDARVACWTPTLEASSYRVQVTAADDTFFQRTLVDDAEVDGTRYVSPETVYPTGSYRWRVQPVDPSGHALAWSEPGSFVVDATPPTATVTGGPRVDAPLTVRFSEPVRGVSGSSVTLVPAAAAALRVALDGRSATLVPARTFTPGQTYTVRLGSGIADVAGNTLVPVTGTAAMDKLVDDGSRALAYAGAWGARSASNAVGGGFRVSTPAMKAQTAATVTLAGKGALVTGCVGPAGGMMDVWVDGSKRGRVDTYRSFSGCGVRLARVALPDGVHRVQVRGVGLKRAASKGTTVSLDAVTAL